MHMADREQRPVIGVMQPYLFPYLGYFQLIGAVDKFVIYDDVNYIKSGWINRNRILVNGQAHLFTLPLKKAGSFTKINSIELDPQATSTWYAKFRRTLAQSYGRAPYLNEVLAILDRIFIVPHLRLADLLLASIREVLAYVPIGTELVASSTSYANDHLHGQARILDICCQEGAGKYINAIGGQELYARDAFSARNMELAFLKSRLPEYHQGKHPFVPGLSILDAMLNVPPDEIRDMLIAYDLV